MVDAKDKGRIGQDDIYQILDYAEEYDAERAFFMISWDTEHSEEIDAICQEQEIEIRKTEWRHPGSTCYCHDSYEEEIYFQKW